MWMQWLVHGKPDAPKAAVDDINRAGCFLHILICTHSSTHFSIFSGELINELEAAGNWSAAIAILASYDSKRASNLPVHDWYRLRRYLEVSLTLLRLKKGDAESDDDTAGPAVLTGVFTLTYSLTHSRAHSLTHSGIRESLLPGIDIRCFFLSEPRDHLYRYIDSRCETMLQNGTNSLTHSLTHSLTKSLKLTHSLIRIVGGSDVITPIR